ncbi:hypothetical protein DRQ53_08085 [bacterium]|nr:MAG: hypothetical protein DRQ53_08085 [bacterium]
MLEGAHLAREIVYLAFAGPYAKVRYWCCKSVDEGHDYSGAYDTMPLVHSVDLNKLSHHPGQRELYADVTLTDGSKEWGKLGYFTLVSNAVAPAVQYSYTLGADGALENPQPLDGATLTAARFYVSATGDYTTATITCCQADNAAMTIALDQQTDPVIDVDLRLLSENTPLEELTVVLTNAESAELARVRVVFELPVADTTDVTLEWTIPNERENGDALPVDELAGYRVEYAEDINGAIVPAYVSGGASSSHDMTLPARVHQFRVTAIDTDGLESNPSPWVEGDLRSGEQLALLLNW